MVWVCLTLVGVAPNQWKSHQVCEKVHYWNRWICLPCLPIMHPTTGPGVDGGRNPVDSPVEVGKYPVIYVFFWIPGGWPWDF